ncbi:hypothetical protein H9X87_01885 [Pseudoflavonifractor capillosus]|nr:hypothetical protein [Pseudoflavonifractor capillosus]MBM6693522.1 hypothetical protein [Pseudoflavonifractor capillosus]
MRSTHGTPTTPGGPKLSSTNSKGQQRMSQTVDQKETEGTVPWATD